MKAVSVSKRLFDFKSILFFESITLASGLLGGLLGGFTGFQSLNCPPLTLSASIFPVVWSILYIFMGFAAYLIWYANDIDSVRVLRLYLLQLLINLLRSIFFFRLGWRLFSFFWTLMLIALVSLVIAGFKYICKPAYILTVPYVLWLIYVAYLNLGFYLMNIA